MENQSATTLLTERLLLRPFQTGDAVAFHEYMSDPEEARYSAFLPLSLE